MRFTYCIWTSMSLTNHSKNYSWTSMPILNQSKSYYWTSMPILNHYNSYYSTSMPILNESEKLPYVLSHPAGLFVPEQLQFVDFLDMPSLEKCAFLEICQFFQKWFPRPNHYAHDVHSKILCRTPVSILKYLSPRPQNLRKTLQ